jgi:hypothetical protein
LQKGEWREVRRGGEGKRDGCYEDKAGERERRRSNCGVEGRGGVEQWETLDAVLNQGWVVVKVCLLCAEVEPEVIRRVNS